MPMLFPAPDPGVGLRCDDPPPPPPLFPLITLGVGLFIILALLAGEALPHQPPWAPLPFQLPASPPAAVT